MCAFFQDIFHLSDLDPEEEIDVKVLSTHGSNSNLWQRMASRLRPKFKSQKSMQSMKSEATPERVRKVKNASEQPAGKDDMNGKGGGTTDIATKNPEQAPLIPGASPEPSAKSFPLQEAKPNKSPQNIAGELDKKSPAMQNVIIHTDSPAHSSVESTHTVVGTSNTEIGVDETRDADAPSEAARPFVFRPDSLGIEKPLYNRQKPKMVYSRPRNPSGNKGDWPDGEPR